MSLRGGVFADVATSTPHVLPCKPALMIEPLWGGHRTDALESGKRWAIGIASHTLAMTGACHCEEASSTTWQPPSFPVIARRRSRRGNLNTPRASMQDRADDRAVARRSWNRRPGDRQTLGNIDRFAYARDDRRKTLAMTYNVIMYNLGRMQKQDAHDAILQTASKTRGR